MAKAQQRLGQGWAKAWPRLGKGWANVGQRLGHDWAKAGQGLAKAGPASLKESKVKSLAKFTWMS